MRGNMIRFSTTCVLLVAALGGEAAAQALPVGSGSFPNQPQTAGALLSGLIAPQQGRSAIFAWHGGVLFSIPELPSSEPNSDFQVRTWDIADPRNPQLLSVLGTSPMPVNAHGYFQNGEYLVLGSNFPAATPWSFRAQAGGSLQRTSYPNFLGVSQRGHVYGPWYVGPTYRLYFPSTEPAEIRYNNQLLGSWDHLGMTGVIGHPFLLGNLLIFAGEESRTGVATYDVSDPANPVLLDVLTAGGPGGYWPELWAGGGRLYAVFPYRLDGNGFRVVDLTDPTDLRFVADRALSGATAQYAQFQDEYAFIGDHKIDMRSLQSVLNFNGAARARTSGGVGVDISQFALPLGNLLITGGIGPNQGMAIWAHQAEPDTRGPSVAFHIPRTGQTGYPLRAPISLIIHETLDSRTVIAGQTFIVRPVGGSPIAGSLTIAFDDILTFAPDQPLAPDTTYEVVLPANGIRDAAGNGMIEHAFTFSTGGTLAGNASPAISAFAPAAYPARPGQSIAFNASATDPEGGALEYRFDFGDGSPAGEWSTQSTAAHTYAGSGHYTATVQVRDAALAIVSAATRVTVVEDPPQTRPTASTSLACDVPARRVLAADVDNGRLLVADADALTLAAAPAVCAKPRSLSRTTGHWWVACEGDDAVVVLDAANFAEAGRIAGGHGSAPMAVVTAPDGQHVYVAWSGRREVGRYRASDFAELGRVTLPAEPRALAVSADGATLFVSRFRSAADEAQVWRLATASLATTGTARLLHFGGAANTDTPASGRGVANHLVNLAIAPRDGGLWIAANKANTARGALIGSELGEDSTVRNLLVGIDPAALSLRRAIDLDNSDSASAAAFSPLGDYALVTLQGNNEVLVLDALRMESDSGLGALVGRFAVGAAPQGVCVDPPTGRSFVWNFLGRSISALETDALFRRGALSFARSEILAPAAEALAPEVLAGKRTFYFAGDPRMSREGYLSCASCHLDGGNDGRVWDFGGRGEGLRNTVDLRGRAGMAHGNVHWSGNFDEIQDFEHDIRSAFGGRGFMSDTDFAAAGQPLGAPKAGRSSALDALAAYVASLDDASIGRSPYRAPDGGQTAAAERGAATFDQLGCASCHAGPRFTDSGSGASLVLRDVGTLRTTSGARLGGALAGIDTPTLLGLWHSEPYLHDGTAATLGDVFDAVGGVVLPTETGTVSAGATLINQFTSINNDDTVRGRAHVGLNVAGATVDLAAVDGGSGGSGAIELRYSAAAAGTLRVIVNGVTHTVAIAASGNVPGFRHTRWRQVRVAGVALSAGASNSVRLQVPPATSMGLAVDEITVSRADDISRAEPHRSVGALDAGARADLLAFLLQLEAPAGPPPTAALIFRSGFESP